jgi:hypothetical protein
MVSGMPLVGFSVKGYRCFAQRQDIELRPVTVVLGRNNSGKSALVRAPVVLATGINTDSPTPFDLDQIGEELVGSFTDLVHGRREDRAVEISLHLEAAGARARLDASVLHIREQHRQVVDELTLRTEQIPPLHLRLELETPIPEVPRYAVDVGGESRAPSSVHFEGLLPNWIGDSSIENGLPLPSQWLRDEVRDRFPQVRYLGPFRDRPKRRYRLPGRPKTDVGAAGEHVAGIIIDDVARRGGRLLRQLNDDIEQHLPGWRVGVEQHGEVWSLVLTARSDGQVSVNLADTGTGVAQALPIFVQRAVDALDPARPDVLEVVEQPELHLHPGAHAALADLYLAAAARTATRFLIETHSETFLLRLRRRIAEGLDPATVAVYFVEQIGNASAVRQIHVDASGDVDYWPEGVFTEDYDETRALAEAQLEREERGELEEHGAC